MITDPEQSRPLTPEEERAWRALIRLMVILPRAIDDDLAHRGGISLTRYVVLMRLSEAPGRTLRMSDLAEVASLSPSRMTRIIQPMVAEALVSRGTSPSDRRANLVTLTDAGLRRLQDAWPAHLAGVRALVLDHIDPGDLADFHRMTDRLRQAVEAAGAGCATEADDEPGRPSGTPAQGVSDRRPGEDQS